MTDGTVTPQRQYDSLLAATQGILNSCAKAGTVKRVVYTSSTAAVMVTPPPPPPPPSRPQHASHPALPLAALPAASRFVGKQGPAPDEYEFTEDDWAGPGGVELLKQKWRSGPDTWDTNSRSREEWGANPPPWTLRPSGRLLT